ncbi:unnamed protein product [Ectocarpus sp. 12 AP-2014]
MQEDEDSQAILSLLQCTNSRLGFSASNGGGGVASGDGTAGAAAAATGDTGGSSTTGGGGGGGRRRARDEYSGELDAHEVANGFGMGMSSKPLKRAKSDGTEPTDVTNAEARARMDRAFTMPQFVTSSAGYAGSARAKKVQRQGSFLSRSGSFHSRSGSLASGKTTVSASKFVFMSSVPGAAAGGAGADDNCARTGFEEPGARDVGAGKEGGEGWNTSRPPFSASGANSAAGKKAGAGAFSGISALKKANGVGNPGGGGDKGRLWKGLCASGKQKARR